MSFEVPPSPVRATRLRWPALAIVTGLIVVVAAAVATQPPAPTPTPSAVALAAAPPAPTPTPSAVALAATPSPLPTAAARTLPRQVDCRQLDASTCRGIAQAALGVLPGDAPLVTKVTVYRSLLCRDDMDCPPARLATSGAPSGSVIVGFADGGPDAWVDVVTQAPADLEAWVLR